MEIVEANKNIVTFYQFHSSLANVWPILRDVRLTSRFSNYMTKNLSTEAFFTTGNNSWEVGSEFFFVWKKYIQIFFRVTEIVETDYFCKLVWSAFKTIPETTTYLLIYNLHTVNDGRCLLVYQLIYSDNYPISKEEADRGNAERWKMFNTFDKCLLLKEHLKFQQESIKIESHLGIIWKMLRNMKMLQRLVPSICDKVEYEGDVLVPGTRMKFIWWKNESFTVILQVKKVKQSKEACQLEYESFEDISMVPKQRVKWKVTKISDTESIIIFTHSFQPQIEPNILNMMSMQKSKILKKIKAIVEKHARLKDGK